jgi:hypothetical protein
MTIREAVLVSTISLVGGWWAGSVSVAPATHAAQTPPRGPRPIGVTDTPAPLTQQLRLKLDTPRRAPSPARNPFVFAARRPAVPAPRTVGRGAEPAAELAPLPASPARASFTLSGIAATGDDRTAIVSAGGSLVFVKAGESLPGGYTVARVEDAALVVLDAAGAEKVVKLP